MSGPGTNVATRAGARAQLTPRAILDAAAADLLAFAHKREGILGRGEHYAFHAAHVAKADSPAHLIEIALADRQIGLRSSKRHTRAIYQNPNVLEAALILARLPP